MLKVKRSSESLSELIDLEIELSKEEKIKNYKDLLKKAQRAQNDEKVEEYYLLIKELEAELKEETEKKE